MNLNKFIGSILIIIGTVIGAGMLALPMISARSGFALAALLLIVIWAIMTVSGLLTLEVNLAFDEYANSFGTMASKTLGKPGKIISWICTLALLYALTSAYIAGNASLLSNIFDLLFHVQTPNWLNATLFLVVMGSLVWWSTRAVDYCNRGLLSIKGILLILTFILLLPHVNLSFLTRIPNNHPVHYLWAAAPIFLCSFGFHPTIPSITNYIGRNPRKLKFIILSGTIASLIIYLFWLWITLSIVPLSGTFSFATINNHGNSVGEFIKTIYILVNNRFVTAAINGFSNIAMTTSFLGVTLGLFDFLADGFHRPNTRVGRLQTACLTFLPPLIFVFFYPYGFILALKYAAIFASVLVVILPALMAYKLRKQHRPEKLLYRVFGGNIVLILIAASGVILIAIQILSWLKIVL